MSEPQRVVFDIADAAQAARYPKHGWATNSQGLKLLWLPIIQLLLRASEVHQEKADSPLFNERAAAHHGRVFEELMRKSALVLQQIHFYKRRLESIELLPDNHDDFILVHQANDMVPLFVDLAYVYFRRLADRLMLAARPLLFEHFGSKRLLEFKNYLEFLADPSSVTRAQPICDMAILEHAFRDHAAWFEIIRREDLTGGSKGVRDAMEHRAVTSRVRLSKVEDGPLEIELLLGAEAKDVDQRLELISTLYELTRGFCHFCTDLHRSIGWGTAYQPWVGLWGNVLPLTGDDDDAIGFWPEI